MSEQEQIVAQQTRVCFIRHQGKDILFINFANSTLEEFAQVIDSSQRVIAAQPPKSILTLSDFTEARYNKEMVSKLLSYVQHNKPFVRAAAVLGVVGLKRVIYNTVCQLTGRNIIAFNNRTQALDWLITQ